ncbi:MAG TPA: PKD domain-containing protein [Flavobacteriales bacterium]|nr:PKD domain-containing protein [Flavobacteriales bacterium]
MKGSDAFERSLKDSLESYEVPYNSADWAQLERQLDKKGGATWHGSVGLYALLLGGALTVATTVYLLTRTTEVKNDGGGAVVGMNDIATSLPPVVLKENTATDPASEGQVSDNDAISTRKATKQMERVALPTRSTAKDVNPGASTEPSSSALVPTAGTKPTAPGLLEIGIKPSVTEGCPGTTVEFAVENLPSNGIFLWNFGDGSFSNLPSPTHTFAKAGSFEVMLSHSSVAGGNIHNKPVSDLIVIHEAPEASFNFMKQEYENTVPSVHFENRSLGGRSYEWDFGDGTTSTIAHPDHVYKKRGSYQVSLTVNNGNGCLDRTDRTVRIDEDYNLLAAKTFSPNADGMDDTFVPEALRTLGVRFHMSIHDPATGQLVYETNDPQRPWNGRIGNRGDLCTAGDYIWMVEMKDGEKLGGTYNGSVSLLR